MLANLIFGRAAPRRINAPPIRILAVKASLKNSQANNIPKTGSKSINKVPACACRRRKPLITKKADTNVIREKRKTTIHDSEKVGRKTDSCEMTVRTKLARKTIRESIKQICVNEYFEEIFLEKMFQPAPVNPANIASAKETVSCVRLTENIKDNPNRDMTKETILKPDSFSLNNVRPKKYPPKVEMA